MATSQTFDAALLVALGVTASNSGAVFAPGDDGPQVAASRGFSRELHGLARRWWSEAHTAAPADIMVSGAFVGAAAMREDGTVSVLLCLRLGPQATPASVKRALLGAADLTARLADSDHMPPDLSIEDLLCASDPAAEVHRRFVEDDCNISRLARRLRCRRKRLYRVMRRLGLTATTC